MFNQRGGDFRRRIYVLVQKFRDAGATSPDRAMTAQELGLLPRFQDAMKRRLGQTGIFVEVNGRYYLNEARLEQVGNARYRRGMQGRGNARNNMLTLRMIRLSVGVATLLLLLGNIFYFRNPEVWIVVGVLLVVTIAISIAQIYYLSRMRRMRNFGTIS